MIRGLVNYIRRTAETGAQYRADIGKASLYPVEDLEEHAAKLAIAGYKLSRRRDPSPETAEVYTTHALFLMRKSGLFKEDLDARHEMVARAYPYAVWVEHAARILSVFTRHLPHDAGVNATVLEVAGWALAQDAYRLIQDVAVELCTTDMGPMQPWADTVLRRLSNMKGVEVDLLQSNPDDAFPEWADKPETLINQIFRGTPFKGLFYVRVPVTFSDEVIRCHGHVAGTTGSGKTTFNDATIEPDVGRKGIVYFCTKGGTYERYATYGLKPEEILHIDATDRTLCPVFNIAQPFIGGRKSNVAKTIAFILAGLDIEMTGLQRNAFEMIGQIVAEIPDANIYTLLNVVSDRRHIEPYEQRLGGNVRRWLDDEYDSDRGRMARNGIAEKVGSIVNSPEIGDLLTGDRNTFDPGMILDQKKMIVISIPKKVVQGNTSIVARCFISAIISAMWVRGVGFGGTKPGWRIIFDEFKDICGPMDNSLPRDVLEQGREFDVSGWFSHQQTEGQMSKDLVASIEANTHVRAYSNITKSDASRFAPGMGLQPGDLMNISKSETHGTFMLWVNGYIGKGVACRVPFGFMQKRKARPQSHIKTLTNSHRDYWSRANGRVQKVTPLMAVQDAEDSKLVHLVPEQKTPAKAPPWKRKKS